MPIRFLVLASLLLASRAAGADTLGSDTLAIVGGDVVPPGQRANVVWVVMAPKDGHAATKCSGVLVRPDVVLSASHCVWSPMYSAEIRALNSHLEGVAFAADSYRAQRRAIAEGLPQTGTFSELVVEVVADGAGSAKGVRRKGVAYAHHPTGIEHARTQLAVGTDKLALSDGALAPPVATQAFNHDFVAIYLDRPVEGVEPARIAPLLRFDDLLADGSDVTAAGYGTHDVFASEFDGSMRTLDTRISMADCGDSCSPSLEVPVRVAAGKDTPCHGDSGGPLFANTEDGPVLVGIASRFNINGFNRQAPCDGSAALLYGRIDTVIDWWDQVADGPVEVEITGGCQTGGSGQSWLWIALCLVVTGARKRRLS